MNTRLVVGLAIPILAVILAFVLGLILIYVSHQQRRLLHDERRRMIDKGMVPPEEPVVVDRPWTLEDHLRYGLILTFLGAGLGLSWMLVRTITIPGPDWLLPFAWPVVGLFGLGNIAYYLLARSRGVGGADGTR